MARNRYSQERIVRLLRLLQPAPREWVARAQRSIAEMLVRDSTPSTDRRLSDSDLVTLTRALERDASFRREFDNDPVAATTAAGWPEIARGLEREIHGLIALAERIAADEVSRVGLDADLVASLKAWDVPADAAEAVLRAMSMPEDLLGRLPEVVAHGHEQAVTRTRLLILLLGTTAVSDTLRSIARRA